MTKYILNSFQTPNAIIDELMPLLTDSEFRVLMFMVREILGWSSSVDSKRSRISQSVMENGYTYTDKQGDEQTKVGCGLSRSTIKKALDALKLYRIIKAIGKPNNDGQMWELCLLTDSNPDMVSLKLRADAQANKAKKRTAKARKVNPKNQIGGSVQQIPLKTDRGVSPTDSQGISPTDTRGVSPTDTNETQETQETHKGAQAPQPDPADNELKSSSDGFVKIRTLVDGLGLLSSKADIDMLVSDFEDYTPEQWLKGIETFKQRRKEKNEFLPYKYLASIVRGIANETKQAAIIEAEKPVIPYHKPHVPIPQVSDDERAAALAIIQQARKEVAS